ncbi:GNAT family N-acetyltransferase [Leptobacterium sp. I13]|uniref:GNAT family N-acetyltransferase n=1 Tax=Leptobacterium meishanense TaxID=3128904 RepID=UPI0030EC4F9E
MLKLKGDNLILRALEPEDLDFLYTIENDEAIWEISNTQTPYSRFVLKKYLENSHQDIYTVKQLRLVISNKEGIFIGLIDVFDFDPKNNRAGIGIIIEKEYQGKGIGKNALSILMDYCFEVLHLHQVYANVGVDNEKSIKLFTGLGFENVGIKKDWNHKGDTYEDEIMFQKINNTCISVK